MGYWRIPQTFITKLNAHSFEVFYVLWYLWYTPLRCSTELFGIGPLIQELNSLPKFSPCAIFTCSLFHKLDKYKLIFSLAVIQLLCTWHILESTEEDHEHPQSG